LTFAFGSFLVLDNPLLVTKVLSLAKYDIIWIIILLSMLNQRDESLLIQPMHYYLDKTLFFNLQLAL